MRRLVAVLAALALLVTVSPSGVLAAPSNDNIGDAAAISGATGSVSGTTVDATSEAGEIFWLTFTHSVWYTWTSSSRKDLVATFQLTDCENSLRAFASYTPVPDWSPFDIPGWSYPKPTCTDQSTMTFFAKAGKTYTIEIAVASTGTPSAFSLSWTTVAAARGSLAITLTNSRTDPASCTVAVKGAGLLDAQGFTVWAGHNEVVGNHVSFQTQAGRWTPATQSVASSLWSVEAGNDVYTNPATFRASDGYSPVSPTIINRCHA